MAPFGICKTLVNTDATDDEIGATLTHDAVIYELNPANQNTDPVVNGIAVTVNNAYNSIFFASSFSRSDKFSECSLWQWGSLQGRGNMWLNRCNGELRFY